MGHSADLPWPLTPELVRHAFRESNGEFAWRRADVDHVVAALLDAGAAILGGEVWWLEPDGRTWYACVPQASGIPGHWTWSIDRIAGESWSTYSERCAQEARARVAQWPRADDVAPNLAGEPVYNLTWSADTPDVK